MKGAKLSVRALKTRQGPDIEVYAFFLPGDQVTEVADISRLRRGEGNLEGFQRKEIRAHVAEIAEFLSQGPVLFPNAIILALSPQVRFESARGPAAERGDVRSGVLHIPIRAEGQRAAWIVDGQQRSVDGFLLARHAPLISCLCCSRASAAYQGISKVVPLVFLASRSV